MKLHNKQCHKLINIIYELKVSNCLKVNAGNTLTCAIEIESFKKCIDKSLHDAIRKNMKSIRKNRNESYLETFGDDINFDYFK